MTTQPPQQPAHSPSRLALSATVLLLLGVTLRAFTFVDPFPYWDSSPLLFDVHLIGLMPWHVFTLDATVLLATALLSLDAWRTRRALPKLLLTLAALGSIPLILHAFILHLGSLEHTRLALAWLSALAASVAGLIAAQQPALRRLIFASFLGFIVALALRGAYQITIEHDATLAHYSSQRDAIQQAQGWSADSSMAAGYERRISQREATGWFALSNVYASHIAVGAAAFLILLFLALRTKALSTLPPPASFALVLSATACLLLLYFSRSKGGIAAFALTLAVTVLLPFLAPRLRPPLLITAIFSVIAAIFIRGALGVSLADRSILFRAFYLDAAIDITADHPLLGVGPAGFQDAYQLAKNPLSPEDVASPHSIFFDYLATLGLLALPLIAYLLTLLARASNTHSKSRCSKSRGTGILPVSSSPHSSLHHDAPPRAHLQLLWLIPAAATILVILAEQAGITPSSSALRIATLLAWGAIAHAAFLLLSRIPSIIQPALLAAAFLYLLHAQLEMTLSWPTSAPLVFLILALAPPPLGSPPSADQPQPTQPRRHPAPLTTALIATILCVATLITATIPAYRWQQHLSRASSHVALVGGLSEALRLTASDPQNPRTARYLEDTLAQLAAATNTQPSALTPTTLQTLLLSYESDALPRAANQLQDASNVYPAHWPTRRELSALYLRHAMLAAEQAAPDQIAERLNTAQAAVEAAPHRTSTVWLTLAQIHSTRAQLLPAQSATALTAAYDARTRAQQLTPYNLRNAVALARLADELDRPDDARRWAERALELNDYMRLDPDVQTLRPSERRIIDAIISAPSP